MVSPGIHVKHVKEPHIDPIHLDSERKTRPATNALILVPVVVATRNVCDVTVTVNRFVSSRRRRPCPLFAFWPRSFLFKHSFLITYNNNKR